MTAPLEAQETPLAIKVSGQIRCAYCHEQARGLLDCCNACGVVLHAECRRALKRCPTLGCSAPAAASLEPTAPGRVAGRAPRQAKGILLFRIVSLLCGLAALGGCASVMLCATTCTPSPLSRERCVAGEIRDAAKLYRIEQGRYPRSVQELCDFGRGTQKAYFDDCPDEISERYRFVTQGGTTWVAVTVREEPPYDRFTTVRLLAVLRPENVGEGLSTGGS